MRRGTSISIISLFFAKGMLSRIIPVSVQPYITFFDRNLNTMRGICRWLYIACQVTLLPFTNCASSILPSLGADQTSRCPSPNRCGRVWRATPADASGCSQFRNLTTLPAACQAQGVDSKFLAWFTPRQCSNSARSVCGSESVGLTSLLLKMPKKHLVNYTPL